MKTILVIAVAISSLTATAQRTVTKVNMDSVQQAVTNKKLATYYPKLVLRLTQFDTTLTNDDYRLLYYGFAFEKDYDGYNDSKKKEIIEEMNDKNWRKALKLCDEALDKVPISLTANYYKGLILYDQDSTDKTAYQYRNRYRKLRNAILSSGDGLSCETAFKTLFVPDEYDLARKYFEVTTGSQSLIGDCDELEVVTTSKYFTAKNIWFDTSESLKATMKMFEKETKKK